MNSKINQNKIPDFQSLKGVKKMSNAKFNYEQEIKTLVDKVANRAEREVPEYGYFAPVYEEFANKNPQQNIDKFRLKVFKMPKQDVPDETKRYIEAAVYVPGSDYKADMLIGAGNKAEILKLLKSDEFPTRLNNAYSKLVDFIQNQG